MSERADAIPVPEMFVAVTVKLYESPLMSPVITQFVAVATVQVFPSGEEVTV
jgi:hypothetical protein